MQVTPSQPGGSCLLHEMQREDKIAEIVRLLAFLLHYRYRYARSKLEINLNGLEPRRSMGVVPWWLPKASLNSDHVFGYRFRPVLRGFDGSR